MVYPEIVAGPIKQTQKCTNIEPLGPTSAGQGYFCQYLFQSYHLLGGACTNEAYASNVQYEVYSYTHKIKSQCVLGFCQHARRILPPGDGICEQERIS